MNVTRVSLSKTSPAIYSDLVIVDEQIYVSGLTSKDWDTGKAVNGDVELETKTILNNLKTLLEQYGSGMDKVIRVEVVLTAIADRDRMNQEYIKHFPQDKLPVRMCYGGVELVGECKVEIMAIAYRTIDVK